MRPREVLVKNVLPFLRAITSSWQSLTGQCVVCAIKKNSLLKKLAKQTFGKKKTNLYFLFFF